MKVSVVGVKIAKRRTATKPSELRDQMTQAAAG